MTENMPPTFEQTRQLYRSLTERVLDKAATDPQWKQQLIDDSEAAMRMANFPETQQLQQMQARTRGEVRGQKFDQDFDVDFDRGDVDIEFRGGWGGGFFKQFNCFWWTYYWG